MDEQKRLARIRLVTERYYELQGLRYVLVGASYLVGMGTALMASGWDLAGTDTFIAFGLTFAVLIPGMWGLDRYYETTFGRIKPAAASQRLTWIIPLTFTAATLFDLIVLRSSQAGIFLALGGLSLWVTVRDWPLRRHHLVVAVSGFFTAAMQLTDVARRSPDTALAAGFMLVGVAAVLTGFADHRLLASVAAGAAEHVDTPASERP